MVWLTMTEGHTPEKARHCQHSHCGIQIDAKVRKRSPNSKSKQIERPEEAKGLARCVTTVPIERKRTQASACWSPPVQSHRPTNMKHRRCMHAQVECLECLPVACKHRVTLATPQPVSSTSNIDITVFVGTIGALSSVEASWAFCTCCISMCTIGWGAVRQSPQPGGRL